MKRTLLLTAIAGMAFAASAVTYTTPGEGVNYTLTKLSAIEGSGVTIEENTFVIANDILVSAADSFSIEPGAVLKMKNATQIQIDGVADFKAPADKRVLITRYNDSAKPKGIYMHTTIKATDFENIDFEYAQLRDFAEAGMNITNCTFRLGNRALNSAGAVSYGKADQINIKDCVFESSVGAALEGSAMEYETGLLVEDCQFIDNNTGNYNKPQINVVSGGKKDVVFRNCKIKGTLRTKVGAISVLNGFGLEGDNNVIIENCDISDSRFGIYLQGGGKGVVNGILTNNKIHGCAVNGGQGITMGALSNTVASGNEFYDNWVGAQFYSSATANLGKVDDPNSPGNNEFSNNKTEGKEIDLQNVTQNTIYAQNNVWGVAEQSEEEIAKVIQNTSTAADGTVTQYGAVIYMPFKDAGVDAVTADGGKFAVNGTTLVAPVESGEVLVFALDGSLAAKLQISGYTASLESLLPGVYVVKVGNLAAKIVR